MEKEVTRQLKKIDYAKDVNVSRFPDHAALVLEQGSMDLKQYLATYAKDGLTGKAMRDAALVDLVVSDAVAAVFLQVGESIFTLCYGYSCLHRLSTMSHPS
eukprot:CAMPEP_0194404136 /NCGR_PEP_ID=MMETSP0176-20130528/2654_1 /TAXON_ID=216777 /ORGANISM="Proboscia alata, Strain PI-D3" /LENGTH=100 /DNA_ID=CAMNT_0039202267 /DNA_START=460 /DNA_END=762 /DNA_ORIENTATION=-